MASAQRKINWDFRHQPLVQVSFEKIICIIMKGHGDGHGQ